MLEAAPKHLWFVRTDKKNTNFFNAEIARGILRQGWGHKPEHNLRLYAEHKDKIKLGGAKDNLGMLKVKAGDWLVAANLPSYGRCTVLKATEDFKTSYHFKPDPELKDFGHHFKIKKLFDFSIHAKAIDSDIRGTLRASRRFWNGDDYKESVYKLYGLSQGEKSEELQTKSTKKERLRHGLNIALGGTALKTIQENFASELNQMLRAGEWEFVLVEVLQALYPSYEVTRVGGRTEKEHGADILITIPNPLAQGNVDNFLIAVQVKDFTGKTGIQAIKQVKKSKTFEGFVGKLIETWVIFIGIDSKNVNTAGVDTDNDKTKIMGRDELNQMLLRYALSQAHEALN